MTDDTAEHRRVRQEAEARVARSLKRRYFISLIMAIVFSFATLAISRQAVVEEFKESHPYDEFMSRLASRETSLERPKGENEKTQKINLETSTAIDQKLTDIDRKLHPAPDLLEASLQIGSVVFISSLWFFAFSLKGMNKKKVRRKLKSMKGKPIPAKEISTYIEIWWPVALTGIPVGLFVVTMHQAYQPAVFVMALAAILVAAEHYTGLKEQEHELEDTRENLASLVSRLRVEVQSIENKTETILNDRGLSQFKRDVYAAYGDATVIYAVVRMHGVDDEWWHSAIPLGGAWSAYERYGREHPQSTLLDVLTRLPGSQLRADFVTDFPMPHSGEWNRRMSDLSAPLFGDILGLAWELEVLARAESRSNGRVSLNSWVSRPLCWIHATDSKIVQVIQREPRYTSSVLTLADMKGGKDAVSRINVGLAADMIEWAQEDIRQYAARGGAADEYLVNVLSYAAHECLASQAERILGEELEKILEFLGMSKWISLRESKRGRPQTSTEETRNIILQIFHEFINTIFRKRALDPDMALVKDLTKGIL